MRRFLFTSCTIEIMLGLLLGRIVLLVIIVVVGHDVCVIFRMSTRFKLKGSVLIAIMHNMLTENWRTVHQEDDF